MVVIETCGGKWYWGKMKPLESVMLEVPMVMVIACCSISGSGNIGFDIGRVLMDICFSIV